MHVKRVLYALNGMCPDRKIVMFPEKNPTEIICEIEPTSAHEHYSVAIAIIDRSALHKHERATEVYEVIRGTLTVYINGNAYQLNETETLTVNPGEEHYAEGDETWVKVMSKPGWTPEDHVLIDENKKQE